MALILFLKSQLGLFDKIVPVAGSVSMDGTVRAPHMAIRHVRAPQPKAAKPAPHESLDLFAKRPATPRPKPQSPTLDLFAHHAKPKATDHHGELLTARQDATARVAAKRAARAAAPKPPPETSAEKPAIEAPPTGGNVNYDKAFDPDKVPAFGVVAGTSKERRREINATVAAMVAGAADQRSAPDLALMRQYSGNGGCGDSLNEFYTDPKVAAAMWKALHDLGVGEGATALEPSCATGVFLETAPAGVKVTGVEMDEVSSRVAMALHPRHEIESASLERFANEDTRQFDVVIGNAPFGLRGSLIKDDKKDLSTAEGYFLDTSLDKAKGGGVVAMIVPTGVLDSKRDRKLRERLLRKGEFLGALRMPNTAFEHSHTGVTTDIVFFRKRPQDVAGALGAVDQATLKKLGVWDDDYLAGSYFTERGAANVLGTMTEGWRAKAGMGDDITVEGSMVGVPEAIAAFAPEAPDTASPTVEAILAACPDEATRERARAGAMLNPYSSAKRGDTKVTDGVTYVLEGEPLRWHRVDEFMQDKAVTDAQGLAAEIERAMGDDGYAEANDLAAKVKAYVEAHGVPGKNTNLKLAAATDKTLYRLIGAVKPDGSLSDVVTGHKAAPMESSFDAAAQSLALENGEFTPEQVAGRWHGGDSEAVLDHLYAAPEYALDPVTGRWTSADQYLSGELWPKLDAAKAALADEAAKPEDRAKYERQAKLLEETIDPKSLEDVDVTLNSAFLPLDVVAAFFNQNDKDFEGRHAPNRMNVSYDKGVYAVSGGPWGSADLMDKYLNRRGVKKDEEWPRIERWNREFKAWLCASPHRDQVEELYNRNFRGFRQRGYSDNAFEIPGLDPEGLKPHIYSGIRQALEMGKGILADDVGLGKTVQGLILARMAKVAGHAKKPLIVVPKSVLANWVAEAEKWFPGSSILTIGETYSHDKDGKLKSKPDTPTERNRKYHDLTQNDYDFVLISQPAWNDLDLDPIIKGEYVEDDFWVQRGDSLGNAGDKRTNKIREAYKQALAKREFSSRTDAIYFNDLGVDMLIGDEMHAYKNLYSAKNRFGKQPKFLGGSGLSNRALDMALKTRWVREHANGKNVYGLTATPTKNSPLEIYSMLTHIAPEAFEKIGIRNSEEFIDRFCEFKTENVLNTAGEIEEALVTTGFKNLGELREIMRRYINRRTAEMVGLQLPERDDREHFVDLSPAQKEVYAGLRLLAEESSKDSTGGAHIFSIMDKMAKAAMDLELFSPDTYKGAHSPKYAEAVKHIVAGSKDGGQVVFAENIAVHHKLVDQLVAAGIPRDRIAIFNAEEAESSAKRQNISDKFNRGELDVVIGNSTMSEGVNLQKRTTDIHHMDLPWEPASLQQRNGRGLRQGNVMESVRLHTYLAKGSFDGYRYQTLMAKKGWQDLLWNGGDRVENLAREGKLSKDDYLVMLSADPDKAREELAKNHVLAEARFKAQKNTAAAEEFGRYQDMKRNYSLMKGKERETSAGRRLRVKLDRMRVLLEENPHFTAKHALDSDKPVLLQPTTGHAYQEGAAFEVPTEGGPIHGGGKFVVTKVLPQVSSVQVRRYGAPNGGHMTIELDKLDHASPFEYDAKAEQAEVTAHLAAAMKDKVDTLKGMKDLHGLPSSVIEGAYDSIQRVAKEGAQGYKFDLGYGNVGLVKDGKAVSVDGYNARKFLDTHDLMLPTDAHRKLAMDAYAKEERGKMFDRTYQSGARGPSGEYRATVKYPGDTYKTDSNRWGTTGDTVFGAGFHKEAHAAFERQQMDAARHAPTLTEAFNHAALAATGTTYTVLGEWPKRALAVLWAKAKREGKLATPLKDVVQNIPSDMFKMGDSSYRDPMTMSVGDVLQGIAKHRKLHDLGAAMAVDGGDHEAAVKRVLGLDIGPHTAPALRHLIAKKPELATRGAGEFANIERSRANWNGGTTSGHPLHTRFGDAAHNMTLADLVDHLTGGDDTGGDARNAA